MTKQFFVLSFGFVAFLLASNMTFADTQDRQTGNLCAPRQVVIQNLVEQFGETPHGIGLTGNTAIVEFHASEETGTWTITVTRPSRVTCMIASGQAFEALKGDEMLGTPAKY